LIVAETKTRIATATAALAWSGAGLALACALIAAVSGLGYEMGIWGLSTGISIFSWSVYGSAGAGALALCGFTLAAARRAGLHSTVSLAGVAITIAVVLPAWNLHQTANQVPNIHDITTDTKNPPQFVALREVRLNAPNGAEYGGAEIAEAQKAGYPDIEPVQLNMPPAQAFEGALAAARKMGWDIVAAEPAQGRIEATATTFWFRFKDDVVIRIVAVASGSRLDIRSMSRIGSSDLGTNARRIRSFLTHMRSRA
jgi:uncharacterized protein (DUF1499 family)